MNNQKIVKSITALVCITGMISLLASCDVSDLINGPQNLTATANEDETAVILSWDAVLDSTGYNVYRAVTAGSFSDSALNGDTLVTTTTYTDSNVEQNISYYYTVTAVDTAGVESEPATAVNITLGEDDSSSTSTTDSFISNITTANRFFVGSYVYTEDGSSQEHNALGIVEFTPTTNNAYDLVMYIIFYQTIDDDSTILNSQKFDLKLYNMDEYTGDHAYGIYEVCDELGGCSEDINQDGVNSIVTFPVTSENYTTLQSEVLDSFDTFKDITFNNSEYNVLQTTQISTNTYSGQTTLETTIFNLHPELFIFNEVEITQTNQGSSEANWSAVATFINYSEFSGNFEDHLSTYGLTLQDITDDDEDGVYASQDCDDNNDSITTTTPNCN
ncbi:MAG: hypothetical protein CMP39_00850 [Rickettsiales bacterium]|nr:hypothetical protein [Rickettsiales bacterium]|tara:strand:- start:4915 stop:6078 length:1164 start_codon:yes stop_codon:yes gene_type:complete